ncbi:MAG: S41 family peptidase [Muribaculaceae bacterium]|nr:S41 family peptidase [Muribaculaceae bacterium]
MNRIITILALATAVICSAQTSNNAQNVVDIYNSQKLRQQEFTPDQKLRQAAMFIDRLYVDHVNTDSIVEEGIKAMLKTLDPHSTYTNPEETRELTEPLQGNFSGIGIQYNMLNDTLYVIQTIAGGPSERVGLLAGDRILSAGDSILSGINRSRTEVTKILRGPKGTTVDIKVLRAGTPKPISFTITRDDIPLYSVDASYMIDKENGYIRISRFAEETADEVRTAISNLKKKGLKNLIIDLEHNGGGYLSSATEVAQMFLKTGDIIVFTNNKDSIPNYLKAEHGGSFGNGRVVLMVNQYSASASEILSGAIQDYDRGVIVGRRTFGKGLVQRPYRFPDGSMIRLTTSRYYTPSGRCIQKPYHSGDDSDYSEDILNRYRHGELSSSDSISFDRNLLFHTINNHRPVYGGGGIMPDCFVPIDTTFYTDYYRDLLAKGVFNKVAMTYVDKNRKTLKEKYPDVNNFASQFNVGQDLIDAIVNEGEKEKVEPNPEQLAISRNYMAAILKALVARDIFDTSAYYQIINDTNPVYKAAIEIISSPARYNSLLGK